MTANSQLKPSFSSWPLWRGSERSSCPAPGMCVCVPEKNTFSADEARLGSRYTHVRGGGGTCCMLGSVHVRTLADRGTKSASRPFQDDGWRRAFCRLRSRHTPCMEEEEWRRRNFPLLLLLLCLPCQEVPLRPVSTRWLTGIHIPTAGGFERGPWGLTIVTAVRISASKKRNNRALACRRLTVEKIEARRCFSRK